MPMIWQIWHSQPLIVTAMPAVTPGRQERQDGRSTSQKATRGAKCAPNWKWPWVEGWVGGEHRQWPMGHNGMWATPRWLSGMVSWKMAP